MAQRLLLALALLALPLLGTPHRFAAPTDAPIRIMPLGDSITLGYPAPEQGGYRAPLRQALTGAHYTVDFVGSQAAGPADPGDNDHEGHGGWCIASIADNVAPWLVAARPDIVLLMIGTNDLNRWNYPRPTTDCDADTASRRLGGLLDRIAAARPGTRVIVATLPPMTDAINNERVTAFNATLPGVIRDRAAAGQPVSVADVGGTLAVGDLADDAHPNSTGYRKLGAAWYGALTGLLPAPSPSPEPIPSQQPTPHPSAPPSPTPSPSAPPVPAPPPFADVAADYWAYRQIGAFATRGITTGCGEDDQGRRLYCPERGVTRAEMATFLARTLGQDRFGPPAIRTFADVPAGHWAYSQIEAFVALGITTGCAEDEQGQRLFCPERGVTRAEMAAFLTRAKRQAELHSATPTFADVPTGYWAYGWIERFFTLGVTTGCGTDENGKAVYCPDRGVTRAEMAVFIIRAYP